jgi:hypothetical protein
MIYSEGISRYICSTYAHVMQQRTSRRERHVQKVADLADGGGLFQHNVVNGQHFVTAIF